MRIVPLYSRKGVYSCVSYLVLGDMNRLEDVNTLVDVGTDGSIVAEIAGIATGAGKKPVQQVVLTHDHFDHSGGLAVIRDRFDPLCCGFSSSSRIDRRLEDGEVLRMGNENFEVIHSPGHTEDSICLYCKRKKILFAGDTQLTIGTTGGTYQDRYLLFLDRLASLEIDTIYPGHGVPLTGGSVLIRHSLHLVAESRIIMTARPVNDLASRV